MGYQALITLDLPDAKEDQREIFYRVLKEEKWHKLPRLTTAWKVSFKDSAMRPGAIRSLEKHINSRQDGSRC